MNDETRKQIQTIIREAQFKINSLCSGYKVGLFESERTESDVQADVRKALQDRQSAGLSASNAPEFAASLVLDGASRDERDLIERALQESRAVPDLEK
jgi:hypothetical protein